MPGQSRIGTPDALHHIMIRRIEGGKIFRDNDDRNRFFERLKMILKETEISCYAWLLSTTIFI